ncbi:MAG: hypothetical protein WCJ62_12340 [Flavobacterium sp.]
MKNNTFKIVALIILVGGGYLIYKRIQVNKATGNLDIIMANDPTRNQTVLSTFQPEFLSAWATALTNKEPNFTFNSKNYSSSTGKAIK